MTLAEENAALRRQVEELRQDAVFLESKMDAAIAMVLRAAAEVSEPIARANIVLDAQALDPDAVQSAVDKDELARLLGPRAKASR